MNERTIADDVLDACEKGKNMSVSIQEFTNKSGRKVKYVEITGEKYPVRIGIQKVKKVLENHKDCEFVLRQIGVIQ